MTGAAWDAAANLWLGWRELPPIFFMSRARLPRLVELNAPDIIIEIEIELTQKRIVNMQTLRQKGLH